MSAPMRRLSIRQLIRWLSVVFLLLTVALLLLVRNERINAESLARAEYQRYASYQAAIELMQTSNDLTRMARLYVSTGEARYAQYYERILGIRAGRAPRPQAQDPFYWDRVLAGTETLDDTSPPRALLDILRELQFTDRELASLTAAQAESEKLAKIEEVAMGSIAAKAARRSTTAPSSRRWWMRTITTPRAASWPASSDASISSMRARRVRCRPWPPKAARCAAGCSSP